MSSKNKTRARQADVDHGAQARRLIDKEHLKDAVKEAKLWFRQVGTEESRLLLEQAYFLRARQLQRGGLTESAREVCGNLLEFGANDPARVGELVSLLMALGMAKEALALSERLGSPDGREALVLKAADAAVLVPERTPASMPELKECALRVRAALEAIEAGDEPRAMENLRTIARGSPLADWRLLAKGLAAYYRRDDLEMHANWDRLDANRAAHRIAARLRALAGRGAVAGVDGAPGGLTAAGWEAQETRVFGGPILADLEQLRDEVAQQDWKAALRRLGGLRGRLRHVDLALTGRVTSILYYNVIRSCNRMIREEGERLIDSFIRTAEALPMDPAWTRLMALIWEGRRGGERQAEMCWIRYIGELGSMASLEPEERKLAQALVWNHVAMLADADEDGGGFAAALSGRSPRRADDRRYSRVVECFEISLDLCPTHKETYNHFYHFLDMWDEPERAEHVARRLLQQFPDDLEATRFVAKGLRSRDEPIEALEFVRRARRLAPLDRDLAGDEWALLLESARAHALARHWDLARDAFEAAAKLKPEACAGFTYLAHRGLFEHKAGRAQSGEEWITRAQAALDDPLPLWLLLSAESVRYRSKDLTKRFANLWKSEQKRKPRSDTAAALTNVLSGYLDHGIKYTGRPAHAKDVLKYLGRARALTYRYEDLRSVCEFLEDEPDQEKLLKTLVDKGLRDFPQAAYFRWKAAEGEVDKGPWRCNRGRANRLLEEALTLAQASADPHDLPLLPEIKQVLTMLAEFGEKHVGRPARRPSYSPFGRPGPANLPPDLAGLPPELLDELARMMDHFGIGVGDFGEDEDEDDDDMEAFGDDPASRSARRPRVSSKKKRK